MSWLIYSSIEQAFWESLFLYYLKPQIILQVSGDSITGSKTTLSWGGLDLAIFRVLGVRQTIHLNKQNWALGVLWNKSSDTKYVQACRR